MGDLELDRSRAIWKQIAEEISRRIASGAYPQGERLPGLVDLASEFGVAVSTIQKVFAHLKTNGEVRTELGLGTWPVSPEERQG
ncbi:MULTISPECIES: GntR family transcriptional regulator [unclassified Streptomyces]|uniref:GntR family transcriptional regulator n=1 Tax=unclassified Streptomyces TaxID=2593676 RepID=UPI003D8C06BA